MALVLFVLILSSCLGSPTLNGNSVNQDAKERISITSRDLVFDSLEKKWISSTYFDRGMKYEGSQLEVVSLSNLLKKYNPGKNFDAILLVLPNLRFSGQTSKTAVTFIVLRWCPWRTLH